MRGKNIALTADFLGARTTKRYRIYPGNDPWPMPTTLAAIPFPPMWRFKHTVRTCNLGGMRELPQVGFSVFWTQIGRHYFHRPLNVGVFHLRGTPEKWKNTGFGKIYAIFWKQ